METKKPEKENAPVEKKGGIHDKHRERMRQRILKDGIDSLQPHEILEYLLYPFVPRKNTNDIAHALIEKFGSYANVLNADFSDLLSVKGITELAALFLCSLPGTYRQYLHSLNTEKVVITNKASMLAYLNAFFKGKSKEEVYLVSLDTHNQLISTVKLGSGDSKSVSVNSKEIVAAAIRAKASYVVLAHNHPSGKTEPSEADIELTSLAVMSLSSIGITLYDHVILGHKRALFIQGHGHLRANEQASGDASG